MQFTAEQIAALLQGEVAGNPQTAVQNFAKIEEGEPGCLSFLANPKYAHYLYETQSGIVLVNRDFEPEQPVSATLIKVDNAYEAVARLLTIYQQTVEKRTGVHPTAVIAATAEVGPDCYVGPHAYIGENVKVGRGCQIYANVVIEERCEVGDDCLFYPGVSIYHDCKIGHRVTIHSGAVIGADGFGFAPAADHYEKIPQIGIVTIEDDVEIGANTCVDRSTMGSTYVRRGVKLDNMVQVAHNCEVGAHTVMSAQVGLAGSTKIGEWCMCGGQSGFAGHIKIGDRCGIGAQAGVISNLKDGTQVIGTPAMDPKGFFRSSAVFKRLPEMLKDLNEIKKTLPQTPPIKGGE